MNGINKNIPIPFYKGASWHRDSLKSLIENTDYFLAEGWRRKIFQDFENQYDL